MNTLFLQNAVGVVHYKVILWVVEAENIDALQYLTLKKEKTKEKKGEFSTPTNISNKTKLKKRRKARKKKRKIKEKVHTE